MAAIPRGNKHRRVSIIDPHIHLFDLSAGDYHWLKPGNPPHWPDKSKICQTFMEEDLALSAPLSLAGFVHIEAGFDNQQPWREIAWLERHCRLPFRAVASVDLSADTFEQQLDQLSAYPSVVGVRDILDERAASLLSLARVRCNLAKIAERGWIFEAQLSLADSAGVDQLCQTLDVVPELRVIINHGGFPSQDPEWLVGLSRLADYSRCAIKCSGWEMLDRQWSMDTVRQQVSTIVSVFGVDRVMLASNFPLCNFSLPLTDLWSFYAFELGLSDTLVTALCSGTASRWYGLADGAEASECVQASD